MVVITSKHGKDKAIGNQGVNVSGNISPRCLNCRTPLHHVFLDLGKSPLCQSRVRLQDLDKSEAFYPLRVHVCDRCFLVQAEQFVRPSELFSEYACFSSYSDSWVEHARHFVETSISRFNLGRQSLVMEIASNDGYLLQHFKKRNVPVLGIEPARKVAKVAVQKGLATLVHFHGQETAESVVSSWGRADLLIGNNVLAHVPDVNDFVSGLKVLLKEKG